MEKKNDKQIVSFTLGFIIGMIIVFILKINAKPDVSSENELHPIIQEKVVDTIYIQKHDTILVPIYKGKILKK